MTTRCAAAGCIADATEEVSLVAAVATTRDDPAHEERGETVEVCAEHALVLRRKALAPYLLRVIARHAAVVEAAMRLESAEAGAASTEDLALVDRWLDDFHQLARLAEGNQDPAWQEAAAQAEDLSERLQPLVGRHLT